MSAGLHDSQTAYSNEGRVSNGMQTSQTHAQQRTGARMINRRRGSADSGQRCNQGNGRGLERGARACGRWTDEDWRQTEAERLLV